MKWPQRRRKDEEWAQKIRNDDYIQLEDSYKELKKAKGEMEDDLTRQRDSWHRKHFRLEEKLKQERDAWEAEKLTLRWQLATLIEVFEDKHQDALELLNKLMKDES